VKIKQNPLQIHNQNLLVGIFQYSGNRCRCFQRPLLEVEEEIHDRLWKMSAQVAIKALSCDCADSLIYANSDFSRPAHSLLRLAYAVLMTALPRHRLE
jgi:hypothetical protein